MGQKAATIMRKKQRMICNLAHDFKELFSI